MLPLGVPVKDAQRAIGDAVARHRELVDEDGLDEREAYKVLVSQFHEAIYKDFTLPEVRLENS